jgi:hypothetical protein
MAKKVPIEVNADLKLLYRQRSEKLEGAIKDNLWHN